MAVRSLLHFPVHWFGLSPGGGMGNETSKTQQFNLWIEPVGRYETKRLLPSFNSFIFWYRHFAVVCLRLTPDNQSINNDDDGYRHTPFSVSVHPHGSGLIMSLILVSLCRWIYLYGQQRIVQNTEHIGFPDSPILSLFLVRVDHLDPRKVHARSV